MLELHRVAEARIGRRMPLNVTGAIAGILLELDIPWQLHPRLCAHQPHGPGWSRTSVRNCGRQSRLRSGRQLFAAAEDHPNVGEDGS